MNAQNPPKFGNPKEADAIFRRVAKRTEQQETPQPEQEQQSQPPSLTPRDVFPQFFAQIDASQSLIAEEEARVGRRLTKDERVSLVSSPHSDHAAAFIALYAAGETLLEFWQHGSPVHPGSDAAADFLAAMVRAKYLTHA